MTDTAASDSISASKNSPDYVKLVQFLVRPFLESPDLLKIHSETFQRGSRILIRLAFDGEDKGRVFGRGGRNIQAIRTVVQAIAQSFGQTVHLDVYGGQPSGRDEPSHDRPPQARQAPHRPRPRKE